jgi:hypothetical protein
MPLEDLTGLGYRVSRPPEDMQPPMPATVWGLGRQWNVPLGADEEEFVAAARNHKALRDKLEAAQQYFADAYASWPTMTAGQKDAASRNAMRALTNLIRHVRDDLTSEGA